eukprot:COSAG01_NODE_45412_length_409_cov_2.825806_1_plen_33_part_01
MRSDDWWLVARDPSNEAGSIPPAMHAAIAGTTD